MSALQAIGVLDVVPSMAPGVFCFLSNRQTPSFFQLPLTCHTPPPPTTLPPPPTAPPPSSKLHELLGAKPAGLFRYGPDKPLVVLRSHWPIDRALKVLLKHNITAAVRR